MVKQIWESENTALYFKLALKARWGLTRWKRAQTEKRMKAGISLIIGGGKNRMEHMCFSGVQMLPGIGSSKHCQAHLAHSCFWYLEIRQDYLLPVQMSSWAQWLKLWIWDPPLNGTSIQENPQTYLVPPHPPSLSSTSYLLGKFWKKLICIPKTRTDFLVYFNNFSSPVLSISVFPWQFQNLVKPETPKSFPRSFRLNVV